MLPRSPRRRRRLLVVAVALAFAVAVGLTVALLPGAPEQAPERFHGSADVVARTPVPVPTRERLAITSTLRRFALAGLGRADLRKAWELSTPGLRAATPRRAWLRGNVPFLEYRARPFRPDAWRAVDATHDEVVLDLLLQPAAGSDSGPATLTFDVRRLGGTWKVHSVYAAVLYSPAGEKPRVFSERDLTPGPSGAPPPASKARLSGAWLLAPVLVFVLLLAAVAVAVARTRRTV